MIEKGAVISVERDIAEVSLVPGKSCHLCPVSASCCLNQGVRVISVRNLIGARPGDKVIIEIADRRGLGAALVLFALPLILAVIGLIISAGLTETYRIIITAGGLGVGLVLAKIVDRAARTNRKFLPNIVDKES